MGGLVCREGPVAVKCSSSRPKGSVEANDARSGVGLKIGFPLARSSFWSCFYFYRYLSRSGVQLRLGFFSVEFACSHRLCSGSPASSHGLKLQVWSIYNPKLSVCVNESLFVSLRQSCDKLVPRPGCTPPSALWYATWIGSSPRPPGALSHRLAMKDNKWNERKLLVGGHLVQR